MLAPVAGPRAAGVNAKNIWQDCPGLSVVLWQFCTPPNTPAAPPTPLITTGALDTLVMVTACCGDVVPTATLPTSIDVGEIRKVFRSAASADPGAAANAARIRNPMNTTEECTRYVARAVRSGLSMFQSSGGLSAHETPDCAGVICDWLSWGPP